MNNESATQDNGEVSLVGNTFDTVQVDTDSTTNEVKDTKEPQPPAAEDTVKPEDKPQDKPVADTEQKKSRVFDNLDPDEVKLFKSMSNEAYSKLYPIYLEYKTLKNQPPPIVEHPEAYTLDPEYQNVLSNLQSLSLEEDYWRDRITEVENGAETIKWLIRDPNTGKYTEEEVSVTPQVKAELLRNFIRAGEYKTRLRDEAESIKNKFLDNHKNFVSTLKSLEEQVFGKLDFNNPAIKSTYENWLSSFPASVRNLPIYQFLAKALTSIQGLVFMLSSNEKRAKTATGNKSPDSPIYGSVPLTPEEVDAQFNRIRNLL